MGAIDVWAQITTERMAKRPWLQTLLRWTGRENGMLESTDSTLQAMDAAGVDITLLSAWVGPVDGKRFVGVRVVPWLWDLPPNDRRYYPIYAACVEAGVPFCTQISHTGPLKRSETGRL